MNQRALIFAAVTLALGIGCDDGNTDTDSGMSSLDSGSGADGGTTGMDGGTDAGGGADAGPLVDANIEPSCDMGRIRIEQTCPTFTACGGDVVGEWCYADVCITKDELLGQVLDQPGVPAGCTADGIEIRGSSGTISGTLTATATELTRMVTSSATGSFYLPMDCVIGTGVRRCITTADVITTALGTAGSATCVVEDPGCVCSITFDSGIDETVGYTISGDAVVLDSGRRFDYCIEGDGSFRFHEDAATGVEPGTQTALPVAAP